MAGKSLVRNAALALVFCAAGFILFTENVRPVQIIGLFACGAVVGALVTNTIAAYRARRKGT
jgi:predicted metal-binding protein